MAHVRDAVGKDNYTVDIDNQSADNYAYDAIGNLKKDVTEDISNIDWTVYGKIKGIAKTGTTIQYGYDPSGNRIAKQVANGDTTGHTYYVRDAQGNTMAVYSRLNNEPIQWEEQHLYGSSRLGLWRWDTLTPTQPPVVASANSLQDSVLLGSTQYELSNHLGNVLATISDKKIGVDSSGIVKYFEAEALSQNDYYPFGMGMAERKYSLARLYRYGFNGKENDDEVKGEGNQQDYGMRIYDPRLGKFLSVDPLTKSYPELTPYQFASNTPLQAIDLDGLEAYFVHGTASDQLRWIDESGAPRENTKQFLRIAGNNTYNAQFNWGRKQILEGNNATKVGNGLFNGKLDRTMAAIKLVNHIMAGANGKESITLIGHSHGGNVAIQAVPLLRAALDAKGWKDVKINLITVATPADNRKGSVENPATWGAMINQHIQIYNTDDVVQTTGANIFGNFDRSPGVIGLIESFSRTYNYSGTQNVKIDVHNEFLIEHSRASIQARSVIEYKTVDGMGAHSFDYSKPELIKKEIDKGTLSRLKK